MTQTDSVSGKLLVSVGNEDVDSLVDQWIMFPLQTFLVDGQVSSQNFKLNLPPEVALLTARREDRSVFLRFHHKHVDEGDPVQVDLREMIDDKPLKNCVELSVDGSRIATGGLEGLVLTISPGDIRTVCCGV